MLGTFSASWRLTKTSLRLALTDRGLLVFPVLAGVSALVGLLLVGLAILYVPLFGGLFTAGGGSFPTVPAIVLLIALYFAVNIVSVYAWGGLVGAAMARLDGRPGTSAEGWACARRNWKRLVVWGILAATVGLVIQLIASRARGIVGLLLVFGAEVSWAVVTYFIVPVLIFEKEPVWRSLSRSARLYVGNFGKTLLSNLALGLLLGLGAFAGFVLLILGSVLALGGSLALGIALLLVGAGLIVFFGILYLAASGVLRAALYRYATTGKIDPDLLPPSVTARAPRPSAGTPLP